MADLERGISVQRAGNNTTLKGGSPLMMTDTERKVQTDAGDEQMVGPYGTSKWGWAVAKRRCV